MSDTNDMRRDFEVWCKTQGGISTFRDSTPIANGGTYEYESAFTNHSWWGWQAATVRATALERERCAALCEGRVYALDHGGNQYRREWTASQCAAAIRQGGDT